MYLSSPAFLLSAVENAPITFVFEHMALDFHQCLFHSLMELIYSKHFIWNVCPWNMLTQCVTFTEGIFYLGNTLFYMWSFK